MHPTSRRPRLSAPGDRLRPAERIPTNADAHSVTVRRAAAVVDATTGEPSARRALLLETRSITLIGSSLE
jgi:hypothetical protein